MAAIEHIGPHSARDETHDIHVLYRFHGFPMRDNVLVKDIEYIPNVIDNIDNENGVVVILTICAHFTATNITFYQNRLYKIRDAIQRLQLRNPKSRVLIKSANTQHHFGQMDLAPWYFWTLDKVMRDIMSGIRNVSIIDVWDMTVGHHSGFDIHPKPSQELDMLFSFLCSNNS